MVLWDVCIVSGLAYAKYEYDIINKWVDKIMSPREDLYNNIVGQLR